MLGYSGFKLQFREVLFADSRGSCCILGSALHAMAVRLEICSSPEAKACNFKLGDEALYFQTSILSSPLQVPSSPLKAISCNLCFAQALVGWAFSVCISLEQTSLRPQLHAVFLPGRVALITSRTTPHCQFHICL